MCIICRIIISHTFHYFDLGLLRLVELNSQMAPSLSQIRVLSTLTMSSSTLETREECAGDENLWFLQPRRSRDRRTAEILHGSLFRSEDTSFAFFSLLDECHLDRDIEWKDMLYCESLQKWIFLAFFNYFESHYRMFANILRSKTIVVLRWRHRPTRPFFAIAGSRASKTNFVFGLFSLDCRLRLPEYFWTDFFKSLSKTETAFFTTSWISYLFINSRRLFRTLSFRSLVKYYLKSKKFAILKHRGKNFVMMASIVHLSSKRS